MTRKGDFKRRVRERKARTGESYMTARRRVLAARTGRASVDVVQLHDVTADAERLGFRCRIALFPELVERAEPASVLAALRDALVGSPGHPANARLFGVAFGVASADFPERERERELRSRGRRMRDYA